MPFTLCLGLGALGWGEQQWWWDRTTRAARCLKEETPAPRKVPGRSCLCLSRPAFRVSVLAWSPLSPGRWAVQGAGCLHRFGNAIPALEARRMRAGKQGELWQSPGWIEVSVAVGGEDSRPAPPLEVSWGSRSCSAGAGAGSDGWGRAGPLVGRVHPSPGEGRAAFHRLPHGAVLGQPWGEWPCWGWPRCSRSGRQKAGAAGTPGVPRACTGESPAPSPSSPVPGQPSTIN